MALKVGENTANQTLVDLTVLEIINYYRDALVAAEGDGQAISALYTQATIYQGRHKKLTRMMKTLRKIEETASPLGVINITTPQGKARYLKLFFDALVFWLRQ